MPASELVAIKQASEFIKSFCHNIMFAKTLGRASLINQAYKIGYFFQDTMTGIRLSQPVGYVLVDRLIRPQTSKFRKEF